MTLANHYTLSRNEVNWILQAELMTPLLRLYLKIGKYVYISICFLLNEANALLYFFSLAGIFGKRHIFIVKKLLFDSQKHL